MIPIDSYTSSQFQIICNFACHAQLTYNTITRILITIFGCSQRIRVKVVSARSAPVNRIVHIVTHATWILQIFQTYTSRQTNQLLHYTRFTLHRTVSRFLTHIIQFGANSQIIIIKLSMQIEILSV